MPKEYQLPNGTILEFPDDATTEEMNQIISQQMMRPMGLGAPPAPPAPSSFEEPSVIPETRGRTHSVGELAWNFPKSGVKLGAGLVTGLPSLVYGAVRGGILTNPAAVQNMVDTASGLVGVGKQALEETVMDPGKTGAALANFAYDNPAEVAAMGLPPVAAGAKAAGLTRLSKIATAVDPMNVAARFAGKLLPTEAGLERRASRWSKSWLKPTEALEQRNVITDPTTKKEVDLWLEAARRGARPGQEGFDVWRGRLKGLKQTVTEAEKSAPPVRGARVLENYDKGVPGRVRTHHDPEAVAEAFASRRERWVRPHSERIRTAELGYAPGEAKPAGLLPPAQNAPVGAPSSSPDFIAGEAGVALNRPYAMEVAPSGSPTAAASLTDTLASGAVSQVPPEISARYGPRLPANPAVMDVDIGNYQRRIAGIDDRLPAAYRPDISPTHAVAPPSAPTFGDYRPDVGPPVVYSGPATATGGAVPGRTRFEPSWQFGQQTVPSDLSVRQANDILSSLNRDIKWGARAPLATSRGSVSASQEANELLREALIAERNRAAPTIEQTNYQRSIEVPIGRAMQRAKHMQERQGAVPWRTLWPGGLATSVGMGGAYATGNPALAALSTAPFLYALAANSPAVASRVASGMARLAPKANAVQDINAVAGPWLGRTTMFQNLFRDEMLKQLEQQSQTTSTERP